MKKIISIILILLIYLISFANITLDSLLIEYEKSVNLRDKYELAFEISIIYAQDQDFLKAIEYSEDALDYAEELNDKLYLGEIHYNIGSLSYDNKNYEEAIEHLLRAEDIYIELESDDDLAWTYNQIGNVYEEMQIDIKALNYYLKAYEIVEKNQDEKSMGGIQNNLANLYVEMKDEDKALEAYNVALAINRRHGSKDWEAINLYNIALIYYDNRDYQKSIEYHKQCLETEIALEDTASYFASYLSIAGCYVGLEDVDNANFYLQKAKLYLEKAIDYFPELQFMIMEGNIAYLEENYERALAKFSKALSEIRKETIFDLESATLNKISKTYEKMNDYESAYEYLREYIAVDDSLDEKINAAALIQRQKQYELEKFQEEINLEREKEKMQQNTKLKQIRFVAMLSLIIFTGLIIVILLINRYGKLQKRSNKVLKDVNRIQNKLISILSHDMKNSLYSIKSGARILSEEIEKLDKDQIIMFTKELSKSTERVYDFMENILLWTKSNANKIEVKFQTLYLYNTVEKIISLLKHSADSKEITIVNEIKESTIIKADKDMLDFIVRNLIQNAIKYSYKNGKIIVTSNIDNNCVNLSVKDNGIGIPKEMLTGLFDSSDNYSRKGTQNEKGTGLGLVITKEFVDKMKGSLECKSEPEKGSEFIVKLPV